MTANMQNPLPQEERNAEKGGDHRTIETRWKTIHERAFTKWTNNVLCNGGHTKCKVENLQTDFKDGIILIKLLECLWPDHAENLTYSEQPNCELENLESFFGYLKEAGIKCANIGKCVFSLEFVILLFISLCKKKS